LSDWLIEYYVVLLSVMRCDESYAAMYEKAELAMEQLDRRVFT